VSGFEKAADLLSKHSFHSADGAADVVRDEGYCQVQLSFGRHGIPNQRLTDGCRL
jgi:hypothetical protein